MLSGHGQPLKIYPFILLGLWFVGIISLIVLSINLSDGHLIYTLDDPYIHLAVAETILQGGYGINTGEYSAPSSSIIYPFLLASTEWFGFGSWGPLVINIIAMAGVVYVVGRIIEDHVLVYKNQNSKLTKSKLFPIILGLAVCFILNGWGLVMTGMEHSLHILAVILVIWEFLKILDDEFYSPAWLIAAVVILPLIRFEGLAMAILSVAGLIYLGQRRAASITALLFLLTFYCWFLFTQSRGLPLLPSSVLLKSGIAANIDGHSGLFQLSKSILGNSLSSLNDRQGVLLMFGMLVTSGLSFKAWQNGHRHTSVIIGGVAVFTGFAHIFFGHYGWFGRYEVYAFATVIVSGLVLGKKYFDHGLVRICTIFALLLIAAPYIYFTVISPLASRNIYQQQYQMHRFAVDYWKRPVAVNDLGWISYNNPSFVLDLYGLGSEEVRRLKLAGEGLSAAVLDELVIRKNVSLIMVYDDWFKGVIPTTWSRVAVLKTSQITSASGQVSFYLTQYANRHEFISLLRQFTTTLPMGAQLNVEP